MLTKTQRNEPAAFDVLVKTKDLGPQKSMQKMCWLLWNRVHLFRNQNSTQFCIEPGFWQKLTLENCLQAMIGIDLSPIGMSYILSFKAYSTLFHPILFSWCGGCQHCYSFAASGIGQHQTDYRRLTVVPASFTKWAFRHNFNASAISEYIRRLRLNKWSSSREINCSEWEHFGGNWKPHDRRSSYSWWPSNSMSFCSSSSATMASPALTIFSFICRVSDIVVESCLSTVWMDAAIDYEDTSILHKPKSQRCCCSSCQWLCRKRIMTYFTWSWNMNLIHFFQVLEVSGIWHDQYACWECRFFCCVLMMTFCALECLYLVLE